MSGATGHRAMRDIREARAELELFASWMQNLRLAHARAVADLRDTRAALIRARDAR